MKYVKTAVLFNIFLLIIVPAPYSRASTSLSLYEATFEVIANQENEFRDVQVELKITYHIDSTLKTGGKKFIEANSIEAVQVTDGKGNPLQFQVSRSGKRYHKINWYFPGISKGEQVVIVRFNLPDALSAAGGKNYFRAYWVGSWVIPVEKALYRFVFPAGYSYKECSVYPQYKYIEGTVEEKRQVEVPIVPLKDESFALAFSPGFTEWRGVERKDEKTEDSAKADYLLEKSEERERDSLRAGLENIPEEDDLQSEEEFPKEWDEEGQETLMSEERGSQSVSPQPEKERKEDELRVSEGEKEKVDEEVKEDAPLDRADYLPEKSEEREGDPLRTVLEGIPEEDALKGEEEFPKEWDEGGQETVMSEERGSQSVSPQPEKEKKEDELRVGEGEKEKVGEEVKEDEPLDRAEHRSEKGKRNVVERVRFGEHDAFSRIVFDLKREVAYSVEADPQENVVIISVPNCTLGPQAKSKELGNSLIKKLVFSEKPGRAVVAKVVLTDSKVSFTHRTLADPHKIVFDVMSKVTEAEGAKSPLESGDRDSEKNVITEEKVSQLVSPPTEEKIEEEGIKEEEIKEEKVGEKVEEEGGVGEEELSGGDKLALSASSTTTTSMLPPRKKGERQAVSEDEKRVYSSARELFRQERYKESLSNLRYFMDLYPRSGLAGSVSFLIGDCYFHLAKEGDLSSYQPAVDAYELALALYPDYEEVPRGLLQLANSYREMRYHFEAEGNYEMLMDRHLDARCIPDAFFWMAENCFQNDEPGEAKGKFQNFMVRYPKSDPLKLKRASFRIADCYAVLKDYAGAQKGYEKALGRWQAYSGLFPETLFYMGLTYLKNGDYDKALSLLYTGLNVFPEQEYNHILLTKIGDIYQKQGEVEEALKVYAQNSILYPGSKGALISEIKMADIGVRKPGFFKFGQYLEPLLVYQRVVENYPATDLAEEALYKQGYAFSEQKRYRAAIASLLKVLEEYTDSDLSKKCVSSLKENLYKLINSYFSEEKYYPILEVYRKYRDPYLAGCNDTKTLFQMGESFRQAGLYPEALEMYGSARRIYPRNHPDDELLLRMGEVYLLKKKYAGAEVAFKKLIKNFPESRFAKLAFHSLADTYYGKENYEKACRTYLSALGEGKRIPRDIKGFFYLGRCYQEMGESALTIDAYKKALKVAEGLGKEQVEQEFVVKSYFQLADFLYQNQKYVDAIRVYTQVAEQYAEDDRAQWALYRIAASYRKMGKKKVDIEFLKKLAEGEGEGKFWEKVVSDGIRNLEWEVKNRKYFTP